jgi:3-dehydroquinate dehydratase-2
MVKILVVNGPNLNLLGEREPGVYGNSTLEEINAGLAEAAAQMDVELEFYQSNHEGGLVEALHRAGEEFDGAILNAAGYTHTSVALRDAVKAIGVPVVEVHLSNPAAREDFRHVSLLAGVVAGTIAGFGPGSYLLAVDWFAFQAEVDDEDGDEVDDGDEDRDEDEDDYEDDEYEDDDDEPDDEEEDGTEDR